MTPLNCILANSKIIQKRVCALIEFNEMFDRSVNTQEHKETKVLIKSVESSGKIMWFYNKNQIERMKIKKGDFSSKFGITKEPESYIVEIVKLFSSFIRNREINV